jgi:predicted transglutaminase-like cysteine proteinase
MNISSIGNAAIDITPLLPSAPPKPKNLVDILMPVTSPFDIYSILNNKLSMKWAVISFTGQKSDAGYEKYLQFPNTQVNAIAQTIVSPTDTDDEKMYKIEQWVQDNITYVSDIKNYGQAELWAYPTVTLRKGSGDCEDGAFLMHSLALHAGISPNRLRTYGGLVYADAYGITTGGHAWTAYNRETDNEWIITDWCYWAKDTPLADRMAMSKDLKYIDDYFYVEASKTVETPYTNKVRYAYLPKGTLFSVQA